MYFSEDSSTITDIDAKNADADAEYAPLTSSESHFPTKKELDDLIRDLSLTKSGAGLLTFRLNEWNLLGDDCKSTAYRNRHLEFSVFFVVIKDLCYCKDVEGLFSAVGIDHDPTQWRLFFDSSTIIYAQFKMYVYGDFKMLGVFLGLQGGYTKYSCFLYLFNSTADGEHYEKMHWPTREELTPGMYYVIREPLVSREKVLLPPLHIKLGLAKQFVKALGFEGEVFQNIRLIFSRVSDVKIKGGIFVRSQISTMLKSESKEEKISETEKKHGKHLEVRLMDFWDIKGTKIRKS